MSGLEAILSQRPNHASVANMTAQGTVPYGKILLGEVAARGATMIDIRCGRCDRHAYGALRQSSGEVPAAETRFSLIT